MNYALRGVLEIDRKKNPVNFYHRSPAEESTCNQLEFCFGFPTSREFIAIHESPTRTWLWGCVSPTPISSEYIPVRFADNSLADFAHMAAITFVDTMLSHEAFNEWLIFHELSNTRLSAPRLSQSDWLGKSRCSFLFCRQGAGSELFLMNSNNLSNFRFSASLTTSDFRQDLNLGFLISTPLRGRPQTRARAQ